MVNYLLQSLKNNVDNNLLIPKRNNNNVNIIKIYVCKYNIINNKRCVH